MLVSLEEWTETGMKGTVSMKDEGNERGKNLRGVENCLAKRRWSSTSRMKKRKAGVGKWTTSTSTSRTHKLRL